MGPLEVKTHRGGGKYLEYLCRCSCQDRTEKWIQAGNLKKGKSQSCGCFKRENARDRSFEDVTGQNFGHLTAVKCLGLVPHGPYHRRNWVFVCDCGSGEIIVRVLSMVRASLKEGYVPGCSECRKRAIQKANRIKDSICPKHHIPRVRLPAPSPSRVKLCSTVGQLVCRKCVNERSLEHYYKSKRVP